MEFRLLGPVEVWAAGRPVDAGRPRQRAVLSTLLVDAGEVVPEHVLVDRVWGDEPPPDVGGTLRAHVTRIRRVIEAANAAEPYPARLVRRTGGYQLDIGRERVDLHRFRALVSSGRAAGDGAAALREAVRLWHGEPLAGVSGAWAARMRETLAHERVDAVVEWARAEIRAGDPAAPLALLTELDAAYPHAEPVAATLIHALCAVGRSAEALVHFAVVRERLVEDLGTDPGPELQAIHRAALRGELDRPVVLRRGVPAQLPADVSAFTGRDPELAHLDAALADPDATAVVISAVSGTAGVGKTALAVRWAHRARDRFPDGQLFVNLRGYDARRPLPADEALAGFLAALGVAPHEIPESLDERAARFRTELADRRMLVVLDNASSVEQVRPLLPGTTSCAVVVTSRDSLGGLVAVHGARRVDLDLLPEPDAIALLRRLIGPRANREPDAVATLAEQCARLPLALRVAAELVANRGAVPLADLVTELRDVHRRLALLDSGGEPGTAVTSVLSWSVRNLPQPVARVFALLGLHPGRDLDAHAVAALAGTGLEQAGDALDRLVRAHLAHRVAGRRVGMHDLLRAFAAVLAGSERTALDRVFDYYLATAAAAMDVLHPAEAYRRPRIPPPATPVPSFVDGRAALQWLDAERANLVAMARHAAAHGWHSHAARLSDTLFRYLDASHWADALVVHTSAREAAQRAGDLAQEARALEAVAGVHHHRGRYERAADLHARARDMARAAGEPVDEARATANLGRALHQLGRLAEAAENYERSIVLYRATDNRNGEARALAMLAGLEGRLGRRSAAAEHSHAALAVFDELGDRIGMADTLTSMGDLENRAGNFASAAALLERSLAIYQDVGSGLGEAWVTDMLGVADTGLGQPEKAAVRHRAALAMHNEMGDRDGESFSRNGLGEAALADGRPAEALAHHERAREVAIDTGAREELGRAFLGLGRARAALGETAAARATLERALALYVELDSPLADGVRQRLAEL